MNKKLITLLLITAASLSLFACQGNNSSTREKIEANETTDDSSEQEKNSLQKYSTFTDNFNTLMSQLPDYTITLLHDIPLEDGDISYSYYITDLYCGDVYNLRITANAEQEVTFATLSSTKKSYGNVSFAVLSCYLYQSMDFTVNDADEFYEEFDLLSQDTIFKKSTYGEYDIICMTLDENDLITFSILIPEEDNTQISKADTTETPTETPEATPEATETPEATATPEKDDNIPTEYKSALNKAESYSEMMHMSKAGIYDQLTSEYGEKFPEEAAQYAIDNMEADWNANALAKAEEYSETMYMSKAGIYDQLISEYGEQFTEEEAQYAIDNIVADWNANALEKAKSYQEMDMSSAAIYDQLVSEYGEQFTAEEAQYAVDNLE